MSRKSNLRHARNPIVGCLAAVLWAGLTYPAAAQVNIEQLTNDPDGPAGNSTANPVTNGRFTVFESNRNFADANPELNSEIFRHSVLIDVAPFTACSAGNSRFPSLAGLLPAFTSTCDLAGTNPDGNTELFVSPSLGIYTQITQTTGLGVLALDISADGDAIAFLSDGDFRGQNGDHNVEVFVYTRSDQLFRQMTNTTTGINNSGVSMDPSGTVIAFPSRNDLTGGNPELNTEIFVVDVTTSDTTQVTSTLNDGSVSPSVTLQNGIPVVAFSSTANLTGGNSDRNQEIFLWNGGELMQVTTTLNAVNDLPWIDDGGTRVAFVSNANLTGGNTDLSGEIFVYDATLASFLQVTSVNAPGSFPHGRPSMAPSGLVLVFASSANLTGENPDGGPEIFQAVTYESPCAATGFRNIIAGTSGDDLLQGTPERDHILGLGGSDRLVAVGRDDCLDGGDGNDRLVGSADRDELHGGDGNDVLLGNDGDDELYGETGFDLFNGGGGFDLCAALPFERVVACEE